MNLYVIQGSTHCRKALATVAHLGLDVEIVELGFLAGEVKKPEYLAINPNGAVPALVDGDFTLTESTAITQYLAAGAAPNALFPEDAKTRADITRWQCWELAHFGRYAGVLTFENILKPRVMAQEPDAQAVAEAMEMFRKYAGVLDAHLARQPHPVGNGATLTDFSIGVWLAFTDAAGLPLDDFPHIRDWYGRIVQLPAWAATAPPEEFTRAG